jgi:hypothetical protein
MIDSQNVFRRAVVSLEWSFIFSMKSLVVVGNLSLTFEVIDTWAQCIGSVIAIEGSNWRSILVIARPAFPNSLWLF